MILYKHTIQQIVLNTVPTDKVIIEKILNINIIYTSAYSQCVILVIMYITLPEILALESNKNLR